ncbi:MAG: glutathione binding-like protein [Candidatus Devosia euplotis]|nr:glutathione binding-like protein [Candidatus Devosia euplotis]
MAEGGDFVAGTQFSLGDIAITLGLHRWFAIPFDRAPMPAAEAYYQRMTQRPAARPWLDSNTP